LRGYLLFKGIEIAEESKWAFDRRFARTEKWTTVRALAVGLIIISSAIMAFVFQLNIRLLSA